MDELDAVEYPGVDTLLKAFRRNVEKIPNEDWLGTRVGDRYEWITWRQCAETAENFSHGLAALRLIPDIKAEGSAWRFNGIQSKNRKEWVLAHLANMYQGVTTVAFYDTLGPDAQKYIIGQTELTTMTVSVDFVSKLTKLKNEGGALMSSLKNLVVFENDVKDEERQNAVKAGLTIYTFDEVVKAGASSASKTTREPSSDDTYMFSYTSGTTGDPKGVKLTHKMILGLGFAVNTRLGDEPLGEKDSYISYLPGAHSFEQGLFGICVTYGVKTGFFSGNVLKLTEDIAILKPTLFPSVPRLFNRIFGKIQDKFKAAAGLKGALARQAIDSKLYYLRNG